MWDGRPFEIEERLFEIEKKLFEIMENRKIWNRKLKIDFLKMGNGYLKSGRPFFLICDLLCIVSKWLSWMWDSRPF